MSPAGLVRQHGLESGKGGSALLRSQHGGAHRGDLLQMHQGRGGNQQVDRRVGHPPQHGKAHLWNGVDASRLPSQLQERPVREEFGSGTRSTEVLEPPGSGQEL